MCWVIFRFCWGLMFRVMRGWEHIVGGWYLGARSDMQPVWQSMKTYAAAPKCSQYEMQPSQHHPPPPPPPPPPESTNALTLGQEFFSPKMLCFFSQRWSKANAQDRTPLKKLTKQYKPTFTDEKRRKLKRVCECLVGKALGWEQVAVKTLTDAGYERVTLGAVSHTCSTSNYPPACFSRLLHTCYSTGEA